MALLNSSHKYKLENLYHLTGTSSSLLSVTASNDWMICITSQYIVLQRCTVRSDIWLYIAGLITHQELLVWAHSFLPQNSTPQAQPMENSFSIFSVLENFSICSWASSDRQIPLATSAEQCFKQDSLLMTQLKTSWGDALSELWEAAQERNWVFFSLKPYIWLEYSTTITMVRILCSLAQPESFSDNTAQTLQQVRNRSSL